MHDLHQYRLAPPYTTKRTISTNKYIKKSKKPLNRKIILPNLHQNRDEGGEQRLNLPITKTCSQRQTLLLLHNLQDLAQTRSQHAVVKVKYTKNLQLFYYINILVSERIASK